MSAASGVKDRSDAPSTMGQNTKITTEDKRSDNVNDTGSPLEVYDAAADSEVQKIPLVDMNALFGGGVDALWGKHAQISQRKRKKVSRLERKLSSNSNLPVRMQLSQEQETVWMEAQQAYIDGDIANVIQKCKHIQQEVQLFPHSYQLLGLIYEDTGDLLKALEMFYIEANLNTREKGLLKNVGFMALHLRKYETGLNACKKALTFAQNRSDVQLHSLKTQLYVHTYRIASAERSLKHVSMKFPNEIDVYVDFAAACFEINRPDLGVRAYTHYICTLMGIASSYFDEKKGQTLYFQGARFIPSSLSPIISSAEGCVVDKIDFSKLFHAARVSIDALLQGIPGENASADNYRHALFLAVIVTEYIVELRQQAFKSFKSDQRMESVPSIPLDMAILFVVCRLNAQEDRKEHAAIALKMVYPLLDMIHKFDDMAIASFSCAANSEFASKEDAQDDIDSSSDTDEDNIVHAQFGGSNLDMEPDHLNNVRAAHRMTFESALYDGNLTKRRSRKLDVFLLHQRVRLITVLRQHGLYTLANKVLAKVLVRLPSIAASLLHVSRVNTNFAKEYQELAATTKESMQSRQVTCNSYASEIYRAIALACLYAGETKNACKLYWNCLDIDSKDSISISGLAFIAFHNSTDIFIDFTADIWRSIQVESFIQPKAIANETTCKDPQVCLLHLLSDHFLQMLVQFERTREKTCREHQYSLSRSENLVTEKETEFSESEAEKDPWDDATVKPNKVWNRKTEENINDKEIDDGSGNYDGRLGAYTNFEMFSDVGRYGEHYDKFTVQNIRAELRTAVTWAEYMLVLKMDKYSYLSVMIPMLEVWAAGIAIRGKPLPVRSKIVDESVLPYKRSHVLVYMKELQACVPSMTYKRKNWLDESQNSIWRLIRCMCHFEPIELVLGKCRLEDIAHTVSEVLKTISHPDALFEKMGSELVSLCRPHFPSRQVYQSYSHSISNSESVQPYLPQMNTSGLFYVLSLRIRNNDVLSKMSKTSADAVSTITLETTSKSFNSKEMAKSDINSTKKPLKDKSVDCPFSSESDSDLSDVHDDDCADKHVHKHKHVEEKRDLIFARNKGNTLSGKESSSAVAILGLDVVRTHKRPKNHREGVRSNNNIKDVPVQGKVLRSIAPKGTATPPGRTDKVGIWETFEQNLLQISQEIDTPLIIATMKITPLCAEAAYNVLKRPYNYAAANIMFREMHSFTDMRTNDAHELPADCLYDIYPNSAVACLLAGHACMRRKQYQESLKLYLDAHLLDPQQPLPCLCIANLLTYMAYYNLVSQRLECYAKALAFLSKYKKTRLHNCDVVSKRRGVEASSAAPHVSTTSAITGTYIDGHEKCGEMYITQMGLLQETFYNLGRTFQEVELFSLAARNYHEALNIADSQRDIFFNSPLQSRGGARKSFTHVTKEAAHNLVIIYKVSNSTDFALQIMHKYLSI